MTYMRISRKLLGKIESTITDSIAPVYISTRADYTGRGSFSAEICVGWIVSDRRFPAMLQAALSEIVSDFRLLDYPDEDTFANFLYEATPSEIFDQVVGELKEDGMGHERIFYLNNVQMIEDDYDPDKDNA